jgi:hypothetical protein
VKIFKTERVDADKLEAALNRFDTEDFDVVHIFPDMNANQFVVVGKRHTDHRGWVEHKLKKPTTGE